VFSPEHIDKRVVESGEAPLSRKRALAPGKWRCHRTMEPLAAVAHRLLEYPFRVPPRLACTMTEHGAFGLE
jgi:hypothetical protein